MIVARAEMRADHAAVRAVNEAAFETSIETNLVDALRRETGPLISLVAESAGEVVGHIMFSPVTLDPHRDLSLLGLAPMAVLPSYQRRGIGSNLVKQGIHECRTLGAAAVVVLGHPSYYPRFGFTPAHRRGIRCEYEVPPDAFMLFELAPDALSGKPGTIRYAAPFSAV